MSQRFRWRAASIVFVAVLTVGTARPQASTFEVASIKTNSSGSRASSTRTLPGGRFVGTNVTVRQLILNAPSIFIALREQIGLKLEAQRGPVEFIVIDKIEHPTSN
jgi:hypothetical protein